MKKQHMMIVILLLVLILAGCAPSWQAPIMGPDTGSRSKVGPSGGEVVETVAASPPAVVIVVPSATPEPTGAPPETVAPEATTPAATTEPLVDAPSAPGDQVQRIQFQPPATTTVVEGALPLGGSEAYVFHAQAEQMATISLSFVDAEVTFSLRGVDSGKAVVAQQATEQLWSAVLPQTQDYLLVVTAPLQAPSGVTQIPYHLELTVEKLPFGLPPPAPELVTQVEALVYVGPGRAFDAVHALPPQVRADVLGRSLDNSWLAIAGPGDGPGPHVWVAAEDVIVEGDVHLVPILDEGL